MMRKQRLELNTNQELVPLPLIIQEATLLELDILELREGILKEMSSNPLLDIDKYNDIKIISSKFEDISKFNESIDENTYWHGEEDEELRIRREEVLSPAIQSPWEKLEIQIESFFESENERKIAREIISNLDGFGYLMIDIEEIANRLNVELQDVEKVRNIFMNFEPFGSGSRDFNEYTAFQLREMGYSVCQEEVSEFLHAHEQVRRKIIPYPFYQEDIEHVRYVIPELIFKYVEGNLELLINEGFYPKIQISKDYHMLLEFAGVEEEVKKYIWEKYERVEKLIENIRKRKDYLRKVGELILDLQKDFLTGKTNRLRPITQSEASKRLRIPVSTLNRILKNKFADTPRGIYSLKFFFKKPYSKGELLELTQEDICGKIKLIIERENKAKPYSDEEIASILNSMGIKISRRTVSKLRSLIGIPDSRDRKG